MADETKTNSAADPVTVTSEVDYEARIQELEAQLVKTAAERENYKTVALSKKGRGEEETDEERMRRIAREEALAMQEASLLNEKDSLARKAIQENKELKVALKNRAQVSTSQSSGGGQSATEVKVEYFSDEQKAQLRKSFDKLPLKGKTFEDFLEEVKKNDLRLKNK